MSRQAKFFGDGFRPALSSQAVIIDGKGACVRSPQDPRFLTDEREFVTVRQAKEGNLIFSRVGDPHLDSWVKGLKLGYAQPPRSWWLDSWLLNVPFMYGSSASLPDLLDCFFGDRGELIQVLTPVHGYFNMWSAAGRFVSVQELDDQGKTRRVFASHFGHAAQADWRPSDVTPEDYYAL